MSERETRVAAGALRKTVLDTLETATPLGAYADGSDARYLFLDERGIRTVVAATTAAQPLAAVSVDLPGLAWDEREMADEYAVTFDALPDARPFRPVHGELAAAIVAQGSGLTEIVVGPVHAGIIEPGRFTFSSGGETIVHMDFQIGYSYRRLERAFANADPLALPQRIARVCGACSASRSLAYAMALESIAGSEVSEPAHLARQIFAELERAYNHILDLGVSAAAAGWAAGLTAGLGLKEQAARLCLAAGGHRLLFDAIVPGGVRDEVLAERAALRTLVQHLEADVARYLAMLFDNSSLMSRWSNTGALSSDDARALAVVGPAHRASGGSVDVRDVAPYGAYRRLPAAVVTESGGDVLARCRVKAGELREALRLVRCAFERLGDDVLDRSPVEVPAGGRAAAVVEGPRGAETVSVSIEAGRIERLHVISASYRNWPAVAHATTENIVPDAPLVNKSFNLCYACADR